MLAVYLSSFITVRRRDVQAALLFVFFAFAVLLVLATQTQAHFNLNINIRVIHIEHEEGGLRMRVRLPMAYLVADKLGRKQPDGSRSPAPYTTNRFEDKKLVHYLNVSALRADPAGLGKIISQGHQLTVDGTQLIPVFVRLRAYPALKQVPFAKLAEAKAALKGEVYADDFKVTYVGDTIVDAEILYPLDTRAMAYTIKSTLDPMLPGQDETANLILDHLGENTLTFRLTGLLNEPVEIARSAFKAFVTFVKEGTRHILAGSDHVLFVFCLVLGALSLPALLWRVTGFTLGHSITLIIGFFGFTPQGSWFIAIIETAIALSIIYAALIAVTSRQGKGATIVTMSIGLLHGLGFSFVLGEILKLDAPNLWQSLLAFNVGVEIGQIGLVVITWPLLMVVMKKVPQKASLIRWALALPCIAIASVWVGQRTLQVMAAL